MANLGVDQGFQLFGGVPAGDDSPEQSMMTNNKTNDMKDE
jgi:hypothetical protein